MNVQEVAGVTIISSEEMLDALHGQKLKDTVKELHPEGGFKLVVDMDKTIFMDSKGCGHLVSLLRVLTKHQREIKIARPTPTVLEILQLSRLDKVFEIYDSLENAKKSFIQSESTSISKDLLRTISDSSSTAESVTETLYVMRPPNGPVFLVYDKELAELLLSKANAKFKQDIKLEIYERKEKDHRRTYN